MLVGTAHWGQNYGITNNQGRLADSALIELIDGLRLLGHTHLDTAPAYGDAETRIGHLAPGFVVQTKITGAGATLHSLESCLCSSLDALRVKAVPGVLVHDWPSLTDSERKTTADFLVRAQGETRISRIGISAYEAADLDSALQVFEQVGVVQVPANALDQRLNGTPQIRDFREIGGKVQARSLFLQGLLAVGAKKTQFNNAPSIDRFMKVAQDHGRSPIQLALDYIKSQDWIDEIVVAPTSLFELREIHEAWLSVPDYEIDWEVLHSNDIDLIDPRRWK